MLGVERPLRTDFDLHSGSVMMAGPGWSVDHQAET